MHNLFKREYEKLKWVKWEYSAGNFQALKKAIPPIPPKHGVYIIRCSNQIHRVRGASDVIYIGQSGGGTRGGKQGIGPGNDGPGRLFNTRGQDKWIREKIEELYPRTSFILECSFTLNKDPKDVEESLLCAYLKSYYDLPPANHQSVKL